METVFEVGDLVEIIKNKADGCVHRKDHKGTILQVGAVGCRVGPDTSANSVSFKYLKLIKKGNSKMNNSIKQRIEALNNGWDKEADDLLNEIYKEANLRLWVDSFGISGNICVVTHGNTLDRIADGEDLENTKRKWHKSFYSQCNKNDVFKEALTFMAEEAGLLEANEGANEGDKAEVEIKGTKWEAKLVRKL